MKSFSTLLLALSLSACVIIEDYSDAWNDATQDPCITQISADHYADTFDENQPPAAARYIHLAGDNYLLLLKQNESDEGGHAYRFTLQNNLLTGFKPNPAKLSDFKKNYADAPAKVKKDKATITQLNEQSLSFLTTIMQDEQYWQPSYKTMYNIRRKTECSLYIPTDDDGLEKGK